MPRALTARRTHSFTESVIRGMTRLADEHHAINLAQGFPNFPTPDLLKEAAARAIREDINQYAITWGAKRLRNAIARKYADWYGMAVNTETEITVTCGATEAMAAVLLALINPGEEVIVFEPFYENYGPDAILCEGKPVFVPLMPGEPLDLIMSLINTRTWDLKPGDQRDALVLFEEEAYELTIHAIRYEDVDTPLGTFHTLLLEPRMDKTAPKGMFKKG